MNWGTNLSPTLDGFCGFFPSHPMHPRSGSEAEGLMMECGRRDFEPVECRIACPCAEAAKKKTFLLRAGSVGEMTSKGKIMKLVLT